MRASSSFIKFLCISAIFVKTISFFYLKYYNNLSYIGGAEAGNDSEYYHAYAVGITDHTVNFWPVLLHFLNNYGLYSRDYVSIILFILSVLAIPFTAAYLIKDNRYVSVTQKRIYWGIVFIIQIYPTLFFISLDIYRDIVMYYLFCVSLLFVKKYINTGNKKILLAILLFNFYLLYLFRSYLGFSLGCAFLLLKSNLNLKRIYYLSIIYLLFIFFLKNYGYLDRVLQYRGEEGFQIGGSSIGIGLLGSNNIEFIFLYIYSILMQLFGLFINSLKAVAAFFSESLLFIVLFCYIIKNKQYLALPFLKFISFFFIIYATIWCLGNDNLGTATRLRVFNYISVYVIAGTIYLEKELLKKEISIKRIKNGACYNIGY